MSHALWLSLQVSVAATVLGTLFGVPLAHLLARRRLPGAPLLSALVLVPMILPPTVVGFGLLWLFGRMGPMDGVLYDLIGSRLIFTPAAAVVAAFVASAPFLVRAAQAGFEGVDPTLEDAARTLGRTEGQVFVAVTLPLAWRSIAAGIALAFARAMGEFGATVMVAGNLPGRTQTASVAIYDAVAAGRTEDAAVLSACLIGVTLVVVLAVGRRPGLP